VWHYKLKVAGRWCEFSTHASSYQEARKARQKAVQAQAEGKLPTDMAKWPLAKAAENWLAGRVHTVARNTRRLEANLTRALCKEFGAKRLGDFGADDIRGYQAKRLATVAPRTVNLEVKILRMILKSAKLWARLADDYKRVPESGRGPGRALSPEDEERLFAMAATKAEWSTAFYAGLLAANTTARGGELKGLHLADVDMIERTMTIRRATTKTNAGSRMVPLNERATWAMVRLLERARLLGSVEPEHYLFPAASFRHTREGAARSAGFDPSVPMQTWRSAWRSVTRAAGLPGLRFHDLRHHAITRLAEAGVPDQTLMSIAGHVSREMLSHYSHIRVQARRDAVAALDAPKRPAPAVAEPAPAMVN